LLNIHFHQTCSLNKKSENLHNILRDISENSKGQQFFKNMDVNFGKRHFFLVDLNMNGDRIGRILYKKR